MINLPDGWHIYIDVSEEYREMARARLEATQPALEGAGVMAASERSECTPERPYNGSGRSFHPDAVEVGEQENGWPGGDIITLECPNCGLRFKEELPQ